MDRRTNDLPREGSGAEPGTPGEAPIPSSAPKQVDIPPRRHYTSTERLSVVRGFLERGGRVADFAISHGVSPASLRNWLNAYEVGGASALESKPNRRNGGGRSRGYYGADERRRIVEAFHKSGPGQREFAQTWGVALKSLSTWLSCYAEAGPKGLEPRPRGRRKADRRSLSPGVKAEITRTKERFPDFGMRKVRDFLRRFQGISVSANSVRKTLDEAGIAPLPLPQARKRRQKPMPPRRFERAEPNQLWQSDITSFLLTRHSTRVYLTVFLDDCSRFVVSWALSTHQRQELVTECLMDGIARFGKPKEVLTDQGRQYFAWRGKSDFEKLLEREGIEHVVSRTHHPETLGKCERLWDTVGTELWERTRPQDLVEARERLAHWFAHYNHFRPHQGIDGLVPADRFFKAEDQVRAALESHMQSSEIALALGQAAKKPVFLIGQIGDQSVSLHGESGRLVMQTSDGGRKEVSLDEIGMPQCGDVMNDERGSNAGSGSMEAERPRRTRRFKKRVRFQVPKPILPVKALWESASEEERARAHRTCALMIEYWLGQKTKAEMVATLDLPPLRVWQLSQSALSGMLAGLLKQPRKGKKGADPMGSKTSELAELRKENTRLKRELERTKQVLELLKDLPFNRGAVASTSTSANESPAGKKKLRSRARPSGPSDLGSPAP